MKHNIKIFLIVVTTVIEALCLFTVRGNAQGIKSISPQPERNELVRTAFSFNYQLFTAQEMKGSYTDGLYGFHLERFSWEWDQVGLLFGGGIIGAEGSGNVIPSDWTVVTNDLGFWAIDLEGTVIVRLAGEQPFKTITPFVGLGLDAFGATEKLTVILQKDTTVGIGSEHKLTTVKGDASALRATLAGHALVGVFIPIGTENALEIDFKALFSANGGFHDLVTSDQESALEKDIYSVVKRPAFNLSGYSIRIALTL